MLATAADPQALLDELMEGVDARGHAPYGLPVPAPVTLVHFGSCTANPVSAATLARHQALSQGGSGLDPQRSLQLRFGAAQCVLAASGTDAEYTVALAMGPQPFCAVMVEADETGSGCLRAAMGLAHSPGCPVEQPLPVRAAVACLRLRDEAGAVLPAATLDRQVFDIAAAHAGTPLLLHHVACSKTGLAAPSEAACLQIQRSHPAGARVVVDASQGRFCHADVRRWLGLGWAVIVTGSKYFGAPPFCGATLLPAGWPRAQGFAAGPGLKARWRLALQDWSVEPVSPTWTRALHEAFVPQLLAAGLAHDGDESGRADRQGILSFDPGLDAARTRQLHRRLIGRGWFLGQPVAAGRRTLLRLAAGVATPMARAATDLDALAQVLRRELAHG